VTTSSPEGGSIRSTHRVGLAATLAVIGLTFTFAVMPAAAVTRTPFNTNLVKNASFEAGSATGGYRAIAVPSWQTLWNMTVVKYGAPNGFPTLAEGQRIAGGKKFFTMGNPASSNSGCYEDGATQTIHIRNRNYAIDAGMVDVTFRAYMGTYDSQSDTAVATLYAESDSTQRELITLNVTQTNSRMVSKSATARLPYGTRTLIAVLWAQNTQGYCDAYFDRVSVVLNPI
jgi:hypothetical protein